MELITTPYDFWGFISQPWHWSVGGVAIAFILFLITWLGHKFGVSTIFENLCTVAGAGKRLPFFDVDLKNSSWRFLFIGGILIGGFIAGNFMQSPEPIAISSQTIEGLQDIGIDYNDPEQVGKGFIPHSIFNFSSVKGLLLALIGGFLVGFGSRYGDGCTSGHAITGLAHLQLPSFVTVIGFFIGGLIMVHLIMPFLFGAA